MIDQYRHLPAMLALLMAASPASSQTLSISGRVLPGTCALATPAITLDSVKADALNVGNNNLKTSNLNFTGCIGVTKALLSFDGTAAEGDALRWKNTATSVPAKGLSIVLLAGASGSTPLKKGDKDIPVIVTGATASYTLRAGYYLPSTSGINAGSVQTEITITATYQ
ncbi:TPA: fimbrial protein [Stenotrophomonas maltophilia]|nr:type 1 fimbrial protein [Stenotrophomonas maltophilia]